MIHELKIKRPFFMDVTSGRKRFELRLNDRNYKIGDLLALNEINGDKYTGRSCLVYVDYILDDIDYCKEGYIIMSIKPCFVEHKNTSVDYTVPIATDYDLTQKKG